MQASLHSDKHAKELALAAHQARDAAVNELRRYFDIPAAAAAAAAAAARTAAAAAPAPAADDNFKRLASPDMGSLAAPRIKGQMGTQHASCESLEALLEVSSRESVKPTHDGDTGRVGGQPAAACRPAPDGRVWHC